MRLVPNKYSMTAALMLLAGGSYAAPPAELPAAMLDWQVYEQRPVGQVCQGFYLSPELELPEQNTNLAAARLFAESRQLNYSPDGGLLLQDDVRLRKGGIYVTADQAQVNADRTRADLFGNLVVRQNNLLMRGTEGEYLLETKQLELSEAHYVIHQQRLRGSAWQLQQLPDGRVTLRDASLTTCAPGDQAWRLVAGRLNLNRESGFGDAYNVRM
ncbi:MAG: LPS-assembly protein LptD, partial [Marinospirillum sp.]|uniref:LptA/OstA family protein n=1 Tax=Marinospirillum sp. TaxID=2183934 RepID=UPI001A043271